jgi:hypothetical protein
MIYDYVDIHVLVLERMYHKRLTGYSQIGYKILVANQPNKINLIYDANSYEPVLKNDFYEVQKEILIVSPFLRKKRIQTILEWLKEPLQNEIPAINFHFCIFVGASCALPIHAQTACEPIRNAVITVKLTESGNSYEVKSCSNTAFSYTQDYIRGILCQCFSRVKKVTKTVCDLEKNVYFCALRIRSLTE